MNTCVTCRFAMPGARLGGEMLLCHRLPQFVIVGVEYWCGEHDRIKTGGMTPPEEERERERARLAEEGRRGSR